MNVWGITGLVVVATFVVLGIVICVYEFTCKTHYGEAEIEKEKSQSVKVPLLYGYPKMDTIVENSETEENGTV